MAKALNAFDNLYFFLLVFADVWESESIEIPAEEKSEKKDDDERTPVASAYLYRLSSGDHSVHKRRRNITKEMHKVRMSKLSGNL